MLIDIYFVIKIFVSNKPLVLHRRVSNDPLLMRFIFYCFRISRPERNQLSTLNNKTLGVSMVNKSRHGD